MNELCAFCQIASNPDLERERIVFENEKYLGMQVLHPETKNHFIVFPKVHANELLEMPNKGDFFETGVQLSEEKIKEYGARAYVLKLNNNIYKFENDPMHVGHTHMHVIPRY